MKGRLKVFAITAMFWLLFFEASRILFLIFQYKEASLYDIKNILSTFYFGLSQDVSAVAWIMTIPVTVSLLSMSSRNRFYVWFMRVYNAVLIVPFTALVIGDSIVYSFWGFRLESFILEYLKTPGDAAASATAIQIILFSVLFLAVSIICIAISDRFIKRHLGSESNTGSARLRAIIHLLILALLWFPARFGTGTRPVGSGSVYFTNHLFPNHAAVNVVWNFGASVIRGTLNSNPYVFTSKPEAEKSFRELMQSSQPSGSILKTGRPNVLIIILESFGSLFTDKGNEEEPVTPEFRKLIPEGIYFSGLYASGSRTDKVLPSILSGYPNLPTIQVIRDDQKTRTMPGIMKLLDSAGYRTSFWYGGDLDFANFSAYVSGAAFRQKITRDDFPKDQWDSRWGVNDGPLFDRLIDSLDRYNEPFGCTILTLSSHEPFDVPMEPVFRGDDQFNRFRNSLFYTDKMLGNFIREAKKSSWWENTLVIIVADHCRRNSVDIPVYEEEIFRIPMLWTGGAVVKKGVVIEKPGNQFDIPLMVANQLGMKSQFKFSKDILSEGARPFAFYTYHEGFVFITDSSKVFYDLRLRGKIKSDGDSSGYAETMGKAFLQCLYDDYLSR